MEKEEEGKMRSEGITDWRGGRGGEPHRLPVLLEDKDDFNTHPKNGPAEKERLLRDTCSFSLNLSSQPLFPTFFKQLNYVVESNEHL